MNLRRTLRESIFVQSFLRRKHITNWIQSGFPQPLPSVLKQEAVLYHAAAGRLDVLVETGTFLGEMVFAQLPFFRKIYSIELSEDLYGKAIKRFKRCQNVQLLLGDSSSRLGEVVSALDSPALFWLDGHYSGGITARGEKVCPIFAELRHVFASDDKHTILIDDARLFDGTDGYPTRAELLGFVEEHSYYKIRIENDLFVLNHPEASLQ